MWMLQFLPDSVILWFTNILLLVGVLAAVAGFFVQRVPFLYKYQLPFKVVGILLLAAGVYFRGGYGVEMVWRDRVAQLEKKLDAAKEESRLANAELAQRGEQQVRYIRGRTEVITRYIDREIVKYDTRFSPGGACEIPKEFIRAHNSAAAQPEQK